MQGCGCKASQYATTLSHTTIFSTGLGWSEIIDVARVLRKHGCSAGFTRSTGVQRRIILRRYHCMNLSHATSLLTYCIFFITTTIALFTVGRSCPSITHQHRITPPTFDKSEIQYVADKVTLRPDIAAAAQVCTLEIPVYAVADVSRNPQEHIIRLLNSLRLSLESFVGRNRHLHHQSCSGGIQRSVQPPSFLLRPAPARVAVDRGRYSSRSSEPGHPWSLLRRQVPVAVVLTRACLWLENISVVETLAQRDGAMEQVRLQWNNSQSTITLLWGGVG